MASYIDDLTRDLMAIFDSAAEEVAAKVGCSVDSLIVGADSDARFLITDEKMAIKQARYISETLILTYPLGANRFKLMPSAFNQEFVGFEKGIPKVCIVERVIKVSLEEDLLEYVPLVMAYSLKPND
jgi:hypothetical protein